MSRPRWPRAKGVIQGYTGVAGVDAKHQIIVAAQAHGTGSEQELLGPVVDALKDLRTEHTVISADAGYHSQANLEQLEEDQIEAFIPDNGYRKRDERYADQVRHQHKPDPLWNKRGKEDQPKRFGPQDFKVADDFSHCICPAGKPLYRNGGNCNVGGYPAIKFTGAKRDCRDCPLRGQCLRNPNQTMVRQVAIFVGKHDSAKESLDRMQRKIDSDTGRQMIGRRFATVEPVAGQPAPQQAARPLHLTGQTESRWAVEALLLGAQHRKARAQWVCPVSAMRFPMQREALQANQQPLSTFTANRNGIRRKRHRRH